MCWVRHRPPVPIVLWWGPLQWVNPWIFGVGGSVVSWGMILKGGRSRARSPMWSLNFFNLHNPSSRITALGLTQPLIGPSTRNVPGEQSAAGARDLQPHRHLWADSLEYVRSSTSQSYRPPRPATGIALLLYFLQVYLFTLLLVVRIVRSSAEAKAFLLSRKFRWSVWPTYPSMQGAPWLRPPG
jgi:hypothetical protein